MAQLTLRHSDFFAALESADQSGSFFVRLPPVHAAALRHAAEAEAGFLRDVPGHRLLRDALNDHAPALTPGAVRQQPGQLPGVSPIPAAAVGPIPAPWTHRHRGARSHTPQSRRRRPPPGSAAPASAPPGPERPGLLPGKGRLQIPHDLRARQKPVQGLQVSLCHPATRSPADLRSMPASLTAANPAGSGSGRC